MAPPLAFGPRPLCFRCQAPVSGVPGRGHDRQLPRRLVHRPRKLGLHPSRVRSPSSSSSFLLFFFLPLLSFAFAPPARVAPSCYTFAGYCASCELQPTKTTGEGMNAGVTGLILDNACLLSSFPPHKTDICQSTWTTGPSSTAPAPAGTRQCGWTEMQIHPTTGCAA